MLKRLKLSFVQAVQVRRDRISHTRGYIANKYNISRALVTKTCKYTDTELLQMYSDYSNKAFDYIKIGNIDEWDDLSAGRIIIEYTAGALCGGRAEVSTYYLLHTHFVPSFSTLTKDSKEALISRALLETGHKEVTVALVGDDGWLDNKFMAVADGVRYSWRELSDIPEIRTILEA